MTGQTKTMKKHLLECKYKQLKQKGLNNTN